MFANISHAILENQRRAYSRHLPFRFPLLSYHIGAEGMSAWGQVNALIQTPENIFLLKFKVEDNTENTQGHTQEKKYDEKCLSIPKKI
ncbi:MAG: hypothetical protein HC913_02855 [Microscillaceae bacterium]|nr:hypothetical protein [Microscillaceae bacterium]